MAVNEGFNGLFKGNGANVARIAPFSAFEFFFYEIYKAKILSGGDISPSKKLLCGALTGMTATTLTFPLDLIRLKLVIRLDNPKKEGKSRPTITGTGMYIYRTYGFFGLYRG